MLIELQICLNPKGNLIDLMKTRTPPPPQKNQTHENEARLKPSCSELATAQSQLVLWAKISTCWIRVEIVTNLLWLHIV